MLKPSILIVEDHANCRGNIKRALNSEYTIYEAENKALMMIEIDKRQFDLILLDLSLPDSTGADIIIDIIKKTAQTPIIVITNDDDPDVAADTIKKGAKDYIQKEKFFKNTLLLKNKISAVLESQTCKRMQTIQSDQILAMSAAVYIPELPEYKGAYLQSEIAIKGGLSLLINGETGTGKSMLVKQLHQKLLSERPLVCIDCGSVCSSLLEAELFGYEKGAFTGADTLKIGKIELANGGILFLDEIGNASIDVQTKLLRVLQEKKICRLGSNKEISVDFILISATNKNLIAAIEKKEFKEDFYYRIKQIEITLPPIRNNPRALKLFTEFYIHYYNEKYKTNFKAENEFWDYILSKAWNGNLRELDLDIQKIVFTASLGQDYHVYMMENPKSSLELGDIHMLKLSYEEKEKEKIIRILDKKGFNISAVARELKIPRTSLLGRMKKYNLVKLLA